MVCTFFQSMFDNIYFTTTQKQQQHIICQFNTQFKFNTQKDLFVFLDKCDIEL